MYCKNIVFQTRVYRSVNTWMLIKSMIVAMSLLYAKTILALGDPLSSWNDTSAKQTIMRFVETISDPNSSDYVKVEERIAVFDNDGTLWTEKPFYNQFVFSLERLKQLVQKNPKLKHDPIMAAFLSGDKKAIQAMDKQGFLKMLAMTHTGMSADEFNTLVRHWATTAKHPRFKRLYTELTYLPQLELLAYLRKNGFTNFIVSGGGMDFIRPWSQAAYGIPPQRVIGSSVVTQFAVEGEKAIIRRLPKIHFIDDKAGKPVGIQRHIGLRPIFAFGNSDGDLEMLQYTTMAKGRRLGLILRHTDADREYRYDRHSKIGRLDKALDMAAENHWVIVDMKKDWKQVFSKKNTANK